MGFLGWHQLDHMQKICTSLQTDKHINTSSLNSYRPDALPDAQLCHSTEGYYAYCKLIIYVCASCIITLRCCIANLF